MADTFYMTVISRWSGIHLTVILLMCASLHSGYTHIPVENMERGFLPSETWLENASNMTMIQEETQQQEQKEPIYSPFQNHYLQYPSPQMPSPVNPWAPASPSTPPPTAPHYSVVINIQQPEALILLCQVEEPLEHISWFWFPCPNHYSAGDGTLIADGTTVSNASLYAVRIIGQSGMFISELHVLQNPIQPGVAGLYRCEAWPHGIPKEDKQQSNPLYHDEFIIGGHSMIKSCFYNVHRDKYYYQHYGPNGYSNRKMQKSYRTPRNKTVPDIFNNFIDVYSETNSTEV